MSEEIYEEIERADDKFLGENELRELYKRKKLKLNKYERNVLEICHNMDVISFLKEEFEKNPIIFDERYYR